MLELFVHEDLGFLRDFTFNDALVLVGDKFRDYACYFAHCLIILFLPMQHYIYEDVWHELYSREFFLHEIFSDDFNYRSFFPLNNPLAYLLTKLANGVGIPSGIVC